LNFFPIEASGIPQTRYYFWSPWFEQLLLYVVPSYLYMQLSVVENC